MSQGNTPNEEFAPPPPKPAQIIIVDDHDFLRAGLRSMLAHEPDLEVVGEAASGTEAISLCDRVRPDLVLMDVTMPEMDGLEATRLIKHEHPRTSVIIVTIHENPDYLLQAIKAGAAGYILKDATQRELISSVRKVLSGETLLSSELAAPLLRKLAAEGKGNPSPLPTLPLRQRSSPPFESLTPREVDVLRLLAQGCTNQQIARNLTIGEGTVKVHAHHLIRKLEVSDRTQAAVRGIRLGIINTG